MLRKFTQLVSKFPFAGKMAIRPAFRSFVNAKKEGKTAKFGWLASLLGIMVFGHARQAMMGLQALRLGMALRIRWIWHVVFVGYTAANIAVTIAQVYLLALCAYYYFAQKRTRLIGAEEDFSGKEIMLMLVVTLGGQALFGYGHTLVQ